MHGQAARVGVGANGWLHQLRAVRFGQTNQGQTRSGRLVQLLLGKRAVPAHARPVCAEQSAGEARVVVVGQAELGLLQFQFEVLTSAQHVHHVGTAHRIVTAVGLLDQQAEAHHLLQVDLHVAGGQPAEASGQFRLASLSSSSAS